MNKTLLLRSVLFCPTDKVSMIEKALGLNPVSGKMIADAVVLDLEDSVSPMMKSLARENVSSVLSNICATTRKLPIIAIRINCIETTTWGTDDLKLLSMRKFDAVVIPKVNSIQSLKHTISRIESRNIPIWAMIETAKGVLNAPSIAESNEVQSLIFGSNDLTKDLKAFYTRDRQPLLYSMSQCILAARAARKKVIDGVFMDISDEIRFREECLAGKNLGFDGKSLIHPNQVQTCNEVFSPSQEEVHQARRLIEAFDTAQAQGRGVAVLDNKLIEHLHYLEAVDLLKRSREIESASNTFQTK